MSAALKELASLGQELDLTEDDLLDDPRAPRADRKLEETIVWKPASALPDPSPRDGWAHHWVRVAHHSGHPDSTNMAKAMREGWQPVPASEYPELTSLNFDRSGNQDIVEFGGLVLCRIPIEKARARSAYYVGLAKKQLGAVNARLREGAGNDDRLQFESEMKTEVKRTSA